MIMIVVVIMMVLLIMLLTMMVVVYSGGNDEIINNLTLYGVHLAIAGLTVAVPEGEAPPPPLPPLHPHLHS